MIFISSGCSFSECITKHIDTWPRHLARELNCDHISTAMSSQGNGLISRKIIYQVSEILKCQPQEDLLVGIMWSGPDRHEIYLENGHTDIKQDNWLENPTNVVTDKKWSILNYHWKSKHSRTYYETFFDEIGQYVYTLEHILRTQWFLKLHNIKYFMTTYTGATLPSFLKSHSETKHLYEQIDFDNFLPVTGEFEWCKDFSNIDFPDPKDYHPGTEQHKAFTKMVILPFLKKNGY